ncbi:lipoprotein [Virgibacillus pantothenticus]|uniref:Lipoprotein n=1 Tax=Virgibacillus pantothenticus TaxID=1473 RepID=A0A0L0QMW6_VIRPA|nr:MULTISPECIES: MetQ/NlpA family ABC transporter substrate-binding protein [Virgibacillus]API93570.1 methionine ABC transporter substrate-binding protein [Virgibacillus sp. 6R]KNE19864.1 methionine ABC transporter substrate-binding protein [Virgibacillus pantothenticus]MBS7430042.1 MetQ/NlpA family ABC transporter substrate-binding protein [Virgibacillus sp. 19R1-5]MBU8564860.1 MetQ/NlpA family ABC transporter substrate-binding protein [Virgibacillus pantothenticus]MBU8599168.1 MetQ/NlpA fami
MKKYILSILFLISLGSVLAACGGDDKTADDNKIIVGASSVPHAEILEEAKPLLEKEGITLEISEYQDYVLPNDDLDRGEIDANYFQHIPFLEQTISDTGYELDYIAGIHIEPIGVYSKGISSIDDIPEGTEVIMSNSVPDHGRILTLFEEQGLIKLDDGVDKAKATIDDIAENPKNLTFSPEYEAATLPEYYEREENALVAINTNYAIDAGLKPTEDGLFIEDEDSPYVNVLAVKKEDKDDEALNKLAEILQSEEIQSFMEEKYDGAVVPVGGKE